MSDQPTIKQNFQRDWRITVCGGGGFIGSHLVGYFRNLGYTKIRAIDLKPLSEWYQVSNDAENLELNLQQEEACRRAVKDCQLVFDLAADMGGWGSSKTTRRTVC